MARLITAQPKFKLLVANIEGASDPSRGPSGNPVKVRTGFEKQLLPEVARGGTPSRSPDYSTPGVTTYQGLLDYTTPQTPVASTGTILVTSNVFTADATLYLGEFTITSNDDYTPGGTTALTAAALQAAIDALPGFSATVLLSTVTVSGPFGPNGNDVRFEAIYAGSVQNFTLSPTEGFLASGEPVIGPPTILP